MDTIILNDNWKLRWTTGQRGGSPYVLKHTDDHDNFAEFRGTPRTLAGSYDETGWLDASVPGEVHCDLIRAGLLDDPRVGINVFKARWVEEMVWYYRRTFTMPEEWLNDRLCLHFAELDLSAIIYLNGEEIARHENAFLPLCIPLNGKVRAGENELVVRIDSGLFNVCDRPVRDKYSATKDAGLLLTKRMWLRKPQYEAEWDWSPRLMNVGISGDVTLLRDPAVTVESRQIRQQVSDDLHSAVITGRLFCSGDTDGCRTEMTVGGITVTAEGLSVSARIDEPQLWYPTGYGEQPLYPVNLRLWKGERLVYENDSTIGLRRVDVDQSPHPEQGRYFVINVNHMPVFLKGANLVPLSLFPAVITAEDYARVVERAQEANMNMLRVWGGGLYERDALYDICDRRGILLWQEFISACAYPPYEEDEALHASILDEARYQVRRLSRHPSLIVWCGNNELPPWGKQLYMEEYPAILREEDPEKYYQPASPYAPKEYMPDGNCWVDTVGDQHPWEVGFLNKDHRDYRRMVCRFPNEGGILGPTNRQALMAITDGTGRYTGGQAFIAHDNMLTYMKEGSAPEEDLRFWTELNTAALPIEAYIAAGGYVQGEGLSDYIDNFRRRAFSSSAAIFWMFNDCWPCSRSWTIIDDEGRRNPAFYHVKRAFQSVRLTLSEEQDGSVTVWGINDSGSDCSATLTTGAFLSDGAMTESHTAPAILPARQVVKLAVLPHAAAPQSAAGSLPIAYAMLTDSAGMLITRNRLLTHRYHEYTLAKPVITVTQEGADTLFCSDRYVMGVCIDLDGIDKMSDNLFDLYPGIPYRVRVADHETVLYTLNEIIAKYR